MPFGFLFNTKNGNELSQLRPIMFRQENIFAINFKKELFIFELFVLN